MNKTLKKGYKESIQAIRGLDKRPTKKEWSNIAKEHGLLTSVTLSNISEKSFTQLCIELRKKKDNKKL